MKRMSKEKRFVIQVDPLEIEDDAIYDNKELKLYECQSGTMSDICSLLNKQDQQIADLEAKLAESEKQRQHLKDWLDDEILTSVDNESYYATINEYEEEVKKLKQQLSEKERQYETLYKLFSEQHEIIDQNELGCFEEVNRLLKEQKDFYIVEKTEYDKMKQGAKDIVKELKEKLAEKDKEIERLNLEFETQEDWQEKWQKLYDETCNLTQDKISFAVEQLTLFKNSIVNKMNNPYSVNIKHILSDFDNQIKELKGE